MSLVDEASKMEPIKETKSYLPYEKELNAYYDECISILSRNIDDIRKYCYKHPRVDPDHKMNLYQTRKTGLFSSEEYLVASHVVSFLVAPRLVESIYAEESRFVNEKGFRVSEMEVIKRLSEDKIILEVFYSPYSYNMEAFHLPISPINRRFLEELGREYEAKDIYNPNFSKKASGEELIEDYLRISPEERVKWFLHNIFKDRE